MEATFGLERRDYIGFLKHIKRKNTPRVFATVWINLLLGIIIGVIGLTTIKILGPQVNIHGPSVLITMILFIVIYYIYASYYQNRFIPAANGHMMRERKYVIDAGGIKVKSKMSESILPWEDVTDFDETDKFYFVMIDTIMAYIIPKERLNDMQRTEMAKMREEYNQGHLVSYFQFLIIII